MYTEEIERANVILVDDYCYTMSHTGSLHSGGGFNDSFNPTAELEKAYKKLLSWPR